MGNITRTGYRRSIELNGRHIAILTTIGAAGAAIDDFGQSLLSREFDELRTAKLIVFWPLDTPRPSGLIGSSRRPGTWCLTLAGAAAIDLEIPLVWSS